MDIALINMPFCYLESPSLALSQLKSVLQEDPDIANRTSIEVHYFQHDFAIWTGLDTYQKIADSETLLLGEWLFSSVFFPDGDVVAHEYVDRYYPTKKQQLLDIRSRIDGFLDDLIRKYNLDSYDVIGLTSLYQQTVPSLALAEKLRQYPGKRVVIMGGGNCEGKMGKALIRNFNCLDFVCSGSGLISFPLFIRHLLNQQMERCHVIPGFFSRFNKCDIDWDTNAIASETPTNAVIKQNYIFGDGFPTIALHGPERSIDHVVTINYHDFLDSFERIIQPLQPNFSPRLVLETSRGCWWGEKSHCTFCGSCGWDISYKSMSVEKAVVYINSVVATHEERASFFECCDQLLPKSYPQQVMPHLKLGTKNTLFYEVRTTMAENDLQALGLAGVKAIQPGVEALSSSLLKLMDKGTSSSHNIAHLKQCAHYGLTPMWTFLIGLPGETADYYEQYRRWIPHLTHLPPPMGISPVGFHRNSPYTWYPEKFDLALRPAQVYRYIYNVPESELNDLAYYFEDTHDQATYKLNLEKYADELSFRVAIWRNAWFQGNRLPQLHFMTDAEGAYVYDSRTSLVRLHRLDEFERDLLERFSAPQKLKTVAKSLSSSERFEAVVGKMLKLGLLFVDDDRGISLVLKKETSEPEMIATLKRQEAKLH
ncbi:RiPP maturation radical SAM C-methyltransferase [Pseudomonas sp. B21-015]|uniref:RiPP maturation radical SAM C-methyltransferase n=1 Tax=Pseudomonas sp. B21-015 TaxID=2895473 RepID=UPI00216065A7|nr:RiPP maturation radical SAM C-methyltransferase [Pseudomonas sp. B21-015]UVM52689.1 RiPP maturation radical SAM C-methyltransferase [Pseudomonas sp. B21-015]